MDSKPIDKTYSEVFKELKDMSKDKIPQSSGSPMNFNSKATSKAPMRYKGK